MHLSNLLKIIRIFQSDLPYKFLNLSKPSESHVDDSTSVNVAAENVEESNALNLEAFADEEKTQIKQVFRDLKWLITEGYVTEYSDGRLFVHQILSENKELNDTSNPNRKRMR